MMSLRRFVAFAISLPTCSAQPSFNCNPCINRADHVVKAVLQGTKSDPFWQQVEAAMRQSERDMRVSLDMELYDTLDTEQMAADIRAAIRATDPPEALIVTIPSDSVKAAVAEAIEADLPVFGLYSGYEHYEELKMQGFIAMDQKEAGIAAGKKLLNITEGATKAAYVTPGFTDEDFDSKRLAGMRSVISDVDKIEKGSMNTDFADCPYDVVLLSSADLLEDAIKSYDKHGCDFISNPIGAFDHSDNIHQALSSGKLAFAVTQQQYLQGAFSVMAATLFATNGKSIASSSESTFGMQTVGPKIIDYPLSDSMQDCLTDAFPVCPNTLTPDGMAESGCDCTKRKNIKIAGVLHAVTTDEFWDVVYVSTKHAAEDFGVELELDRMEPNIDPKVLHEKMAGQIESLCKESVDGIFVTIPNETILDEIELCLSLNVPVISINAGPEYSKDLQLYHHIGMVEKNAGIQAGKRMASTGQMKKALCLIHAPNNVVLTDRCGGFATGVAAIDPDIEYLGAINVPEDNDLRYKQIVEARVKGETGDEGDWEGVGILLPGQPQIAPGLLLKESHPKVLLGAFDTNDQLFEALEVGDMLFGIDQGPYLQGYLPVALLIWYAYTNQQLSNHLIESGPAFVTNAPSAEESACQASHFPVCARPEPIDTTLPQSKSTEVQNQGAIIAISVVIVVLAFAITFLAYRIHQLNRYVRQTRDSGQEVPKITAGSYFAAMTQSPEEVVQRMNSVN